MGPKFLVPAEKAAKETPGSGDKTMLQILEEIRANKKLAGSVHWTDGNKIMEGVLARAPDEMVKYAGLFKVDGDRLEEKMVESVNVVGKKAVLICIFGLVRTDSKSVLYRRRSAPVEGSQIRLLPHPLLECIHLPHQIPRSPVPGRSLQSTSPGVERPP